MAIRQPMWRVRARHWWKHNRAQVRAHAADAGKGAAGFATFMALATLMLGWTA